MNPSIEEIVEGLLDGRYTKDQALQWLDTHMEAAESGTLLDEFAAKAMAALIGRGYTNENGAAIKAYAYGRAMLAARQQEDGNG